MNLIVFQVCGTNGKFSTIQALRAILKEAKYKCNIYTSPHIKKLMKDSYIIMKKLMMKT